MSATPLPFDEINRYYHGLGWAVADGSIRTGIEFACAALKARDPIMPKNSDELILGPDSVLRVDDLSTRHLDNLLDTARSILATPMVLGMGKEGLGPDVAGSLLTTVAFHGARILSTRTVEHRPLSQLPLAAGVLDAFAKAGPFPRQKTINELIGTLHGSANGCGDIDNPLWRDVIRTTVSWTLRHSMRRWLTSSLFSAVPDLDPAEPPHTKTAYALSVRMERAVESLRWLMRRPGMTLLHYALRLLDIPEVREALVREFPDRMVHFDKRAALFKATETTLPILCEGYALVGPTLFTGTPWPATQGTVVDRELHNIPEPCVDPRLFDPRSAGTKFVIGASDINSSPIGKALRRVREEAGLLFPACELMLAKWQREYDVLEATDKKWSMSSTAWGGVPFPAVARTRAVAGTELRMVYSSGVALSSSEGTSEKARMLLTHPIFPVMALPAAPGSLPTTPWRRSRTIEPMVLGSLANPKSGAAPEWTTPVVLRLRPQDTTQDPFMLVGPFDPRVLRPLHEYAGEPGFLPSPYDPTLLAARAGYTSADEMGAAIAADPKVWAQLYKRDPSTGALVKTSPGSDLFESSLTTQPYLAAITLPRTAITTHVLYYAERRPWRLLVAGSEQLFDQLHPLADSDIRLALEAYADGLLPA